MTTNDEKIEIRQAEPGEVESFLDEQIANDGLEWHPVGCTQPQWHERIGGHPLEQGTYVRTARGVFMAGMCGSFYVGQKRDDGTIDTSIRFDGDGFGWDEVIIEYADARNCQYTRDEAGRIVLPPDAEDW